MPSGNRFLPAASCGELPCEHAKRAEVLCTTGTVLGLAQTVGPLTLRSGLVGAALYGAQWAAWRDLVLVGQRFTAYGMDTDVLEAALPGIVRDEAQIMEIST